MSPGSTPTSTRAGASREDRRTQAERSGATIEQLLSTARKLFAEKGFAGTSIEEIVRGAGVTRGAMYHHFKSKEDVFEAVFRREQEMLAERVREAAAKKRKAWDQLKAGCDDFLIASLAPDIQQICMIDAPAVLGPSRMVVLDDPHSMALIMMALNKAMENGEVRKRPAMPLAQLLFGALCQGAMVAARSEDPAATMSDIRKEVQTLLDAIQKG